MVYAYLKYRSLIVTYGLFNTVKFVFFIILLKGDFNKRS